MINRSYLPFQSARDYQDVGMQKWLGFFLSEHTSALSEEANKLTSPSEFSPEHKLLLLSQLYARQLTARIEVAEKNQVLTYLGTIPSLTRSNVLVKTAVGHINLQLEDIISIELIDGVLDESA